MLKKTLIISTALAYVLSVPAMAHPTAAVASKPAISGASSDHAVLVAHKKSSAVAAADDTGAKKKKKKKKKAA